VQSNDQTYEILWIRVHEYFAIEEDLTLIFSYLAISQDPVQSNDQTYEILWISVHEYFHAHTTSETKRTIGSLQNR
jgi:hypothetical protein